jgi:preprotein translocase subunit SecF
MKSGGLKKVYEKHYKLLLVVPVLLLVLGLIQVGYQQASTGSFLIKDISLKGGTTLTIFSDRPILASEWEAGLLAAYPSEMFNVRVLEDNGKAVGFIVETSLPGEQIDELLLIIQGKIGPLSADNYSVEIIGSSLGSSFFKETFIALIVAFVLMGAVVLVYFRVFVPSIAVILSAFSDIVVTLAIANLIGIKISTAGLAAFLMLIGYSVDTDILLSTHVVKRREVAVIESVYRAMRTGFMTVGTTIVAITIALFFSKSAVISEIMTIVLIGMVVDLVTTWILNAGILRLYMEKNEQA